MDIAWLDLIEAKEPALNRVIAAAMTRSDKSYLIYMAARLLEMRRILKPTGSIYLHCDPTMSHYLKPVMDAVFGRKAFRNEIVWSYQRWTGATKHFQRMHDIILFYAASCKTVFNALQESYSAKSRHKGARRTVFAEGTIEQSYTDDTSRMKSMRDVWDISYLNSQAKKRTGYPTQKPRSLLERIIAASSDPGDMVLDPFCGCATACIAAQDLNREWVGIDVSPKAAELVLSRLRNELGMFAHHTVVNRTDIPQRTDIGKLIRYNDVRNRRTLYGEQGGNCNGCRTHFRLPNLTVDHIIPRSRGGTDHIGNLQLLCGRCNSVKGNRAWNT